MSDLHIYYLKLLIHPILITFIDLIVNVWRIFKVIGWGEKLKIFKFPEQVQAHPYLIQELNTCMVEINFFFLILYGQTHQQKVEIRKISQPNLKLDDSSLRLGFGKTGWEEKYVRGSNRVSRKDLHACQVLEISGTNEQGFMRASQLKIIIKKKNILKLSEY